MSRKILVATVLTSALAAPAMAEEMTDAALKLCEKVKSCAMEQMDAQNLTPQMRQMIEPALKTMCDSVQGRMQELPAGHDLYEPALACMQSMEALTCEKLQGGGDITTEACAAYQAAAEKYQEPSS